MICQTHKRVVVTADVIRDAMSSGFCNSDSTRLTRCVSYGG